MTLSIHIVAVGKNKDAALQSLIDDYIKRMNWRVTISEIPAPNVSDAERKAREAEWISKAIPGKSVIIALDERGDNPDSISFAKRIEHFATTGASTIVFVIGGADGLDETIRNAADMVLSFGKLTWPHMMVRLMLVEQLYRASTILSGHPYHRQ